MNKSYCPKAFKEIYSDSAGRYRLCCHARPNKTYNANVNDTLPFDYFLSNEIEEYRQKMFENELIDECKICYDIEKKSDTSYRKKAMEEHGITDNIDGITLKVRAFGSYCNLACYMCHPYNSTTRQNEINKIFNSDELYLKFIKPGGMTAKSKRTKKDDFEKYMSHILENIDKIGKFQMIGGETLQLPKYWEFLNRIPDQYARNIAISQETNLSKIEYKGNTLKGLSNKFRHVYLGVSVDHFGKKNEFIRYPINHSEFEKNVDMILTMEKINFKFNATVSILNIDDIFEIDKYYENRFRKRITFHNIVRGPEYLSIRNLPQQLKNEYMKKYKDYPYIIAELKQPNTMPIKIFFEYCDLLANHRGTDWRSEWSDFIQKLNYYDDTIAIC